MTRMEFDERMNALNVEQRKAAQPFNDRMQAIVAEKTNIAKKIAELKANSRQLGAEYEMYHIQCIKSNNMYEGRKYNLRQQFNANYRPMPKQPVDKQTMHNLRRCVLACLKNALTGKCNTDEIEFNFDYDADGNIRFECDIPEINVE